MLKTVQSKDIKSHSIVSLVVLIRLEFNIFYLWRQRNNIEISDLYQEHPYQAGVSPEMIRNERSD
jgi:hypothetical protein